MLDAETRNIRSLLDASLERVLFKRRKMYVYLFHKIFSDSFVAHKLSRGKHTYTAHLLHTVSVGYRMYRNRFVSFRSWLRLFIFIFRLFLWRFAGSEYTTYNMHVCLVWSECVCVCVCLKYQTHTRTKVIIRIFMASYSACVNFFFLLHILFARIYKRSPSSCVNYKEHTVHFIAYN